MKKLLTVFVLILLLTAAAIGTVSAQSLTKEEIASTFTKAILREQFVNKTNPQYYRFAKRIWYFDNLALSYFPSEIISGLSWEYIDNPGYSWYFHAVQKPVQDDWALLAREDTGKVYKQMVYIDEPIEKDVIHGLDFPKVTYQSDFYLYTDLFILDNYPENSGSAYVYFSNSPLYGNRTSYGILIDPRDGIYKATNNYDSFRNVTNTSAYSGLYLLGTETHDLELIQKLDPTLYEGKTGSIGNDIFKAEDLDGKFSADLDAIKQSAVKDGLSENPSVYRIELIRLNGNTSVYINGVFICEFQDKIKTDGLTYYSSRSDEAPVYMGINLKEITGTVTFDKFTINKIDNETWTVSVPESITDMVSWTIGPRLYAGGETVTMASGNFYIYGK
ncbi:MAG: hypothetical protein IJI14_11845 [Anaerolineaceae bacterium]|nr:hypothetical protein [Anaerolineaceae bacterium]